MAKDEEIGSHFLLENHEFLGDKTCHLMTKNRIPGSVTPCAFVTAAHIVCYEPAKRVSSTMLDDDAVTYPADSHLGADYFPLFEFTRRTVAKARDTPLSTGINAYRPKMVPSTAAHRNQGRSVPKGRRAGEKRACVSQPTQEIDLALENWARF